jgi:general secretion pathway protein L
MLYIWMPEANGMWHWSNGEQWHAAQNIEQLSRMLPDLSLQETVVFFPSRDIQLITQPMPKAQYKKLGTEGVKYLLEEYVIHPIDQLKVLHHFHQPDQVSILGMGQYQLDTYQHALHLLPSKVSALLPDYLLAPYIDGKIVIWAHADRILIRESEWTGRSCDDLSLYLQLQSNPTEYVCMGLNEQQLTQVYAHIDAENVILMEPTFATFKKPQQHPFNILPKSKSNTVTFNGYFKACAGVFAAVLLVQFSYDALRWVQNKNIADATAQQAIEQYQSWFGENTRVSEQNLKSQFESHLRLSQAADTQALQLLSRIGPFLMQQQVVAQSVKYEAQQLNMELKAASAETIRKLTEQLNQQGLKVELGNIQATAQGAIGQVKIQ